MVDLQSLNVEQRRCVENTNGALVILAGAGTGKTRVITYRIAHILSQGVSPSEVLALTFTNKAAREMKERIGVLIGDDRCSKLQIGTFHSFCLRALRVHGEQAGLTGRFQIASINDQRELVNKCLQEKNFTTSFRAELIHQAISAAKNKLLSPDDLRKINKPISCYPNTVIADIYSLYDQLLQLHHHIDFDDCIFRFYRLLLDSPSTHERLTQQFRHVLVDEFQDTNLAQLKLVEMLARTHRNVCVVGDDDQSIYSWRGAHSGIFSEFEKIFPETQLVKLEQNYRSTNTILDAANALIINNSGRKEKKLWSEQTGDKPILLAHQSDETQEAQWVAQKILALLGSGYRAADIAILYRSNQQARQFELALRAVNIGYQVFGGQSLFERKEMRDLLSVLKLIANPHDRLSFYRIINTPSRGFGLKSLELIAKLEKKHSCSPFVVIERHLDELPTKLHAPAKNFTHLVRTQNEKTALESPVEIFQFIKEVIESFQLALDVRNRIKDERQRFRKLEQLHALPKWFERLAEQIEDAKNLHLETLIDHLSLDQGPSLQKDQDQHKQNVSLMTIHAAKGLEFPCVFVTGLEDGLFPHRQNLDEPRALEEERRLFYVALTRAKQQLFLTAARRRQQSDFLDLSRFLSELPDSLVLRKETKTETPKKERTLTRLAKIRSSLRESHSG